MAATSSSVMGSGSDQAEMLTTGSYRRAGDRCWPETVQAPMPLLDLAVQHEPDLLELLEVAVSALRHRAAQAAEEVERAVGFVGGAEEQLPHRTQRGSGDAEFA